MRTTLWFLTCPVLGKQIEYALIDWMTDVAQKRHATVLDVPFLEGRDNQVLHTFLAHLAGDGSADALTVLPPRTERMFRLSLAGLKDRAAAQAPNPAAVAAMVSAVRLAGPARAHA